MNKGKVTFFKGILLSLLLQCSALLDAAPNDTKDLVIGVEDISYYPYYDYTSDVATLSKTILEQFATDMGYHLVYVSLPIKQFSKWLLDNDIDFKYPDNKEWYRNDVKTINQSEYFSDDIFYLRAGTVVLAENKEKPKTFLKNLGVISGFDLGQWQTQIANKEINVLDDTSTKVLMKHLATGLVDGVDLDISVGQHYLKDLGIEKELTYSDALPQYIFSHQLSTLKYPEIILEFNQWLAQNGHFLHETLLKFRVPIEYPTTAKTN